MREVAIASGKLVLVSDWTRRHVNFFRSIQITKSILFVILLLVIAVAAFNIVSTLVMVVKDKQGDIAILRTIGARPSSVLGIFITQGSIIGVIGTALGIVAGVTLAVMSVVPIRMPVTCGLAASPCYSHWSQRSTRRGWRRARHRPRHCDMTEQAVLECKGVVRRFREGPAVLEVLSGVDLRVMPAERIAIIGASGSGKTVLMRQLIRSRKRADAIAEAGELLARVGLGERLHHKPGELSGGERQRAAVARALISRPELVLADEPTGNLDAGNGKHVLGLMLELNRELGTSLVIVTHDQSIAGQMDRVLVLQNGRLGGRD